ncbi:MAG TPA: sigma factor G inhibitor Gin [Desulfobacteria bacterium]|nr:sigma factor G inhibitor Gin [Desulfobacteria bacterium]
METNLLPVCIICGQTPSLGIMDGVILKGKFLCSNCEQHILSLEVDSADYEQVVEKLRPIWT